RTLHDVAARRRVCIFASSRDKEVPVLLSLLNDHFDEILLTRYLNNPRALDEQSLSEIAAETLTTSWRTLPTPADALADAQRDAHSDDLICVTGSFFLAAEAKEILIGIPTSC